MQPTAQQYSIPFFLGYLAKMIQLEGFCKYVYILFGCHVEILLCIDIIISRKLCNGKNDGELEILCRKKKK